MYEYIKGRFTSKSATQVVVEAGGIGYDISISLNTFTLIKDAEEGKIYIHLVVREDAHVLYGFADVDERTMFRNLITVSGVGATTARMILSSLNPKELQQAIVGGNAPLLQRIKGIGTKSAQRIIIDLKDKLTKDPVEVSQILHTHGNTIRNEALSALLVLGFPKAQAEKAIDAAARKGNDASVEDLIKGALANL
ncbi:MAG: Holliday junction branch migration protein RuvA [Bacteroidia bacterium]